jgi:iron(III) transport system substrate-binding protein
MRLLHVTRTGAVVAALVLLAAACGDDDAGDGGDGGGGGAQAQLDDADALGGDAAVAAMTELYEAAQDAGEDTVVLYGPGEDDRRPAYDLFEERFPGISVQGEFLIGPDLDSKFSQEIASGRHVADVIHTGDTTIAAHMAEDRYEPFAPVTAEGLDDSFSDPDGVVHSASASTFGMLYNTDMVSADEAPAGWEDILDPRWRGQMAAEDPTRFGGVFGALNKLLNDDRYDEGFVEALSEQELNVLASIPAAGEAVATGEFPMMPFYPYSFYARDIDRGAPVAFVFPVEGGNHLSPHYLGLVDGAPHPEAAKLLITWLFTPEAQQALADVGYYPTMPDGPAPEDYPPVNELDLLEPFAIAEVNEITAGHLDTVRAAFE